MLKSLYNELKEPRKAFSPLLMGFALIISDLD